jgi:hypothetical protein
MKKTSKSRTTRKTSFRFTKEDRESVKVVLRPEFKRVYKESLASEGRVLREIPVAAARALPHFGGDWRIVEEWDDQHNIPFPLRTDVRIDRVRKAVEALFPDEADKLRKNIIAYIERAKAEKRAWRRMGEKWARAMSGRDGFIRHIWYHFGHGHLAGEVLYRMLTPDTQSRIRRARMKVDQLRVTPGFAAKVISELLVEECQVSRRDIDDQKLTKRFQDMPLP